MTDRAVIVGRLADSVRVRELDDELSVFDTTTGTALALNRTAADVLAFADGTTSVGELVRTLAQAYQVEPDDIVDDVHGVVAQLADAGVIIRPE